jgi:macrophage erythroblast attacher
VPFERLSQQFRRTQKLVSKEVAQVAGDIQSLTTEDTLSEEEVSQKLTDFTQRLGVLKSKLLASKKNEERFIRIFQKRIAHLEEGSNGDAENARDWAMVRLDRFLIDYLLRQGHINTCRVIAKSSGIEDLVDIDVFLSAHEIVAALEQQNTEPALRWCSENGPKLRRLNHPIEFKLRMQGFIELVRQDKKSDALLYARTQLSPMAADHVQEIQQAMTTLAFADPQKTALAEYQVQYLLLNDKATEPVQVTDLGPKEIWVAS